MFIDDTENLRIVNLNAIVEFEIVPETVQDDEKDITNFAVYGYFFPREIDKYGNRLHSKDKDFVLLGDFDNPITAAKYIKKIVGGDSVGDKTPMNNLANGYYPFEQIYGYKKISPEELQRYTKEVVYFATGI